MVPPIISWFHLLYSAGRERGRGKWFGGFFSPQFLDLVRRRFGPESARRREKNAAESQEWMWGATLIVTENYRSRGGAIAKITAWGETCAARGGFVCSFVFLVSVFMGRVFSELQLFLEPDAQKYNKGA